MQTDRFGATHSSESIPAISAFEDAVFAVAAHRPIGSALSLALSHDEHFVAAHALNGFGHVILARSETVAAAHKILAQAEASLALRGRGTASERALVSALKFAVAGKSQLAADALDVHLREMPKDFLALKISHALRFMSGQSAAMLKTTARTLPSWSPDDAAFGFVLGCHAFGLEECGQYGDAEDFGRTAFAHQPADAWGLHAVSHVMEMSRRTSEGSAWLDAARPQWRRCNNFAYHLGWHLALFKLEDGDTDGVLALYDDDIAPVANDDFRDMANASSILWRLELEGVGVGERWQTLREVAYKRREDVTYVFGTLHYLLTLVAVGDASAIAELMEKLRHLADVQNSDQGKVAAEIGLPLAEIILSLSAGVASPHDLVAAALHLPSIGGSHAQRDVFLRTLLVAAAASANSAALLSIARIRQNMRSADRFIGVVEKHHTRRKSSASRVAPIRLAS